MRTRVSLLGAAFCAVALAACSGGGSTPTPKNTSFRPAANGDAFGYAGTMTETFVRPPIPADGVQPSPNPINSETITTAVSQAVTVSTAATFQGVTNPFDFHDVETDAVNGGLKTTTVTSDNFYTYVKSGKTTTITFAGSNTSTSDGVTDLDVTGTGNGLVDIFPEAAGAISPANTAARTITETEPDLAQDVRAINADGTYTDTMTNADGSTATATANADGSGSYSFPLLAAVGTNSTYSVAAPASGSIVITVTFAPALLGGGPEPMPITVPVWYPVPLVLSSETLVDNGPMALPAACGVPAHLTKKSHQIVDTKSTVDPVFGELDTQTTTTYTEAGIGVACVQLSDAVEGFYDLSGQTQFTLAFSGTTPFQTTTTTEMLGITAATVLGLASVERASEAAFRAGTARFETQLAHRRALRHVAFQRALAAHFKGGRI